MVHHPATIVGIHNRDTSNQKKVTNLQRMNLEQGTWVAGSDEVFWLYDTFLTREEAEEFARCEGYTHVGTIHRPNPADSINDAQVLKHIMCDDGPFKGEWFEGYLVDGVTTEMNVDLESRLAKAMEGWLTKHDMWPTSCNVENVHEVREAENQFHGTTATDSEEVPF